MNPLATMVELDDRVKRILRRLPTDGPLNRRAFELMQDYRRCVLQSLQALPASATIDERVELVELYQLGLVADLGDLESVARVTPKAEGGFA